MARPAHRRLPAARHRADEPHRFRQGGRRPLHRRAVRARLRRQPADHPPGRQRAAQRRAPRPLALPHRGARTHLRREAHHRTRPSRRRLCSTSSPWPAGRPTRRSSRSCRRRSTSTRRPRLAGAGQSRHPRQCADAGRPLRHARGDEAALRLRLARIRARRHDDLRRRRPTSHSARRRESASPRSTPSTRDKIDAGYTLDPAKITADRQSPDVIVAAANAKRRDRALLRAGRERPPTSARRSRARQRPATTTRGAKAAWSPPPARSSPPSPSPIRCATPPQSLYLDTQAPAQGLETCGKGGERHGRRALVAFACSLNDPLMNRTAQVGQARVKKLIDDLGFNMPPTNADGSGTPPSTAVVLGQVAAAPRRVHQHCRCRAGEPYRPRGNAAAGTHADQELRLHQH